MTVAIAEISGADSIAAALHHVSLHPATTRLVPTYVETGTEFGDFAGIEGNVAFLSAELARMGVELAPLERAGEPAMWAALNGRFARVLTERFGVWLPCVGCHLYLHLMRAPLARAHDATTIISGEREKHGSRTKANQTPDVLDAYARALAHAGLELTLPVRTVATGAELDTILGPRWPGGSPQLACVLSGNERTIDGSSGIAEVPAELIERFLVPAGVELLDELLSGGRDWESRVAEVLREATT
jgi:hypothetical protein